MPDVTPTTGGYAPGGYLTTGGYAPGGYPAQRDILPVGSVVRLVGADALLMVMGLEPDLGGGETADYMGVPYPMGLVSQDVAVAFDAMAVDEVVHRGLWDDEAEAGIAAVRRFRAATADAERRVRELIDGLTPERFSELRDYYTFGASEDEPEPDLPDLFDLPDEPEPDFPDDGGDLA